MSSAVREDAALNALKVRLGAPNTTTSGSLNNSTAALPAPTNAASDAFLLRFLRNKKLHVEDTIAKLRRRREFERCLPQLSVTPTMVTCLRSGAFAVLGTDVVRRPVLLVRLHTLRSILGDATAAAMFSSSSRSSGHSSGGSATASSNSTASNTALVAVHDGITDEIEKLFIMLLEYLQSLSFFSNTQEVALLVMDQASERSWYAHSAFLTDTSLATLMGKYYPDMVGNVLMVDASWVAKQRVRSVASSSNKTQNMVQLVSRLDLGRFFDPSIIPEDLGGRHVGTAPFEFSEHVLRYWYRAVAALQKEGTSNSTRPLWIPLPLLSDVSGSVLSTTSGPLSRQQHRVWNSTTATPREGMNRSRRHSTHRGGPHSSAGTADATTDAATDDGLCSAMSDSDLDILDDEDVSAYHESETNKTAAAVVGGNPNNNGGALSTVHLDLKRERERRMKLEHELNLLTLGISLESTMMTKLEATLRQIHGEVNVLIGEAIVKAKALTPSSGGGGADGGSTGQRKSNNNSNNGASSGPSLFQLLDMTDQLILSIIQERQPAPAVNKFAAPVGNRAAQRGGSCDVM